MDDSRESPRPSRPAIVVETLSDWVAVVTLRGEHDLGTKTELSGALARACERPRVLVDLSECVFLDSSVLALLLAAHRTQVERDGRLELVIPSEAHAVLRITRLARIETIIAIHETRGAALAGYQSQG
jgi:anti-anti-sigma factor